MLPNKRALLLELKPHAEQCNPGPEQLRSCGYLGLWMSYYVFIYIMSESWTPSLCSLCFYSFLPFFFPFWVVEICNINPAARMTLRANWPGPVKLPWAVEEFLLLQQVREGLVFPCRVTSEPISGAAPWLLSQALTQWLYMTSWKIRSQTVAWRGTDQTVLQALFSLK